jgi:NADH-quinone oxidoreductase subunit I
MIGKGILKGMVETARNLTGSFHDPDRLTTVEYPEQKIPAKENARNFPFLIYDGDDWETGLRCVSCQICEKDAHHNAFTSKRTKRKNPIFSAKCKCNPRYSISMFRSAWAAKSVLRFALLSPSEWITILSTPGQTVLNPCY